MNILFICSRNKWRSLTAETIYKGRQDISVKSAGTEPSARIRLNAKLVLWADLIFVMEKEHKQRITERFSDEAREKKIVVLDIPDEYQFMDPELIDTIKASVEPILRSY
jgi:protein-tyrosine phosphatase